MKNRRDLLKTLLVAPFAATALAQRQEDEDLDNLGPALEAVAEATDDAAKSLKVTAEGADKIRESLPRLRSMGSSMSMDIDGVTHTFPLEVEDALPANHQLAHRWTTERPASYSDTHLWVYDLAKNDVVRVD